jgi:two-component system C4-dicarboxylate transport sensor histidine kinase DctB
MNASQEDLARTHRLRGLADMAGGMAHEFNQPLTIIRGCAENILIARQRGWNLPPERIDDKLATIIAQCDRISGLIDHVRGFARGATDMQLGPIALGEAVDDALRLMRVQLASRGIAIAVEDAAPGRLARGNRHAIAEIVIELLRNAREALVRANRSDGRVAVRVSAEAGRLVLTVRDDGPGMSAARMATALEPFRGGEPGDGPGLGLPIARHTAEAMGGSLTLASTPGDGTTVTLALEEAVPNA